MPLTVTDNNDPLATTSRNKRKEILSQAFCLRWDNFQNNMINVFERLFQDETFVDVTLACDGHLIKAHKIVLSANSPYFQEIFTTNPCQHPVIIMKDIPLNDLKLVMEFMYKGEINVNKNQIAPLLKVAEALKIRGLADGNETNESEEPMPSTSTAQDTAINKTYRTTDNDLPTKRKVRNSSVDSIEYVDENASTQSAKKRKKRIVKKPSTSTRHTHRSLMENESSSTDFDDDDSHSDVSSFEQQFVVESVRSIKEEKDLLDFSSAHDTRDNNGKVLLNGKEVDRRDIEAIHRNSTFGEKGDSLFVAKLAYTLWPKEVLVKRTVTNKKGRIVDGGRLSPEKYSFIEDELRKRVNREKCSRRERYERCATKRLNIMLKTCISNSRASLSKQNKFTHISER